MRKIFKSKTLFIISAVLLLNSHLLFAEEETANTEEADEAATEQQPVEEVDEAAAEQQPVEEAAAQQQETPLQAEDSGGVHFKGETLMNYRHSAAFLSRHGARSVVAGIAMGSDETKMSASSKDVTITKSPFILDVKGVYPVNPKVWAGFGFLTDSTKIFYSNDLPGGKKNWVEIDFAGAYALNEKTTLGLDLIQVTATIEENGYDSVSASYITFVPSVRYLMGTYEILASYRPSRKTESGDGSVRDYGSLDVEGNYFMAADTRLGLSLRRVFNKAVDSDGMEDSWDFAFSYRNLIKPDIWTGASFEIQQAKYKDESYLTDETMGSWSLCFDGEWLWRGKQTIGGLFKYTSGSDERVVYGGGGKLDVEFKKSAWLLGANYKYQF